jgi:hypothetical protein
MFSPSAIYSAIEVLSLWHQAELVDYDIASVQKNGPALLHSMAGPTSFRKL